MEEAEEHYVPPALVVDVWFAAVPDLANPLLADVLREELAHVEVFDGEVRITHEELFTSDLVGDPAWGATVIEAVERPSLPATEFTSWPQATEALASARGCLRLREDLPGYCSPVSRMSAFQAVLSALRGATLPLAFAWLASEEVTLPDVVDASTGWLNVRRQASPEISGGWIVDTVGLEPFDIPDIECHYIGLDDVVVEREVRTHAEKMLSGEEFIADGDPVVAGDLWFTARYTFATSDPHRRVVALVPPSANAVNPPPEPGLDDEGD